MLKRWFTLHEEMAPHLAARVDSPDPAPDAHEPGREADPPPRAPLAMAAPGGNSLASAKYVSFDQIYNSAAVKPPRIPYGILKVADMVNSQHLSGMSGEVKRCSLLMALEAAGAEVEDLLQDAVVRQRALNDYEESQKTRLKEFEQVKTDENNKIQAELDRLTGQYMSRIQANVDDIAREQDHFHLWQKQKQQEAQRITEAATFCVPQGCAAGANSLTAVLERASASHR